MFVCVVGVAVVAVVGDAVVGTNKKVNYKRHAHVYTKYQNHHNMCAVVVLCLLELWFSRVCCCFVADCCLFVLLVLLLLRLWMMLLWGQTKSQLQKQIRMYEITKQT